MPIYEYRCDECGHELEVMQKFSDEPLKDCPECGGKVHKLISNTSFVLKGSGWYADGYASTAKKGNGKKSDNTAESKPSTEAAPASK